MDSDIIVPTIYMEDSTDTVEETFDFEQHRLKSIDEYRRVRDLYLRFADVVRHILQASLDTSKVLYHEIEARAKDFESFGKKAAKSQDADQQKPKYPQPLKEITDLAGVRVITFFPKTLASVDKCIHGEFQIIEKTDKSEQLEEEGKFGYKSIHYLIKMKPERLNLPEYRQFSDLIAEIQARTILQHAWAEMEHDIQYKSIDVIPKSVRRRFIALAGMLEIADREFQAIQDEDDKLRTQARTDVQRGRLNRVEITPDAVKAYLDKRLGTDGRMSLFSYEFLARTLRQMGFTNFQQIDECIAGYDDNQLSRILWGTRQGQISRFEDLLRAGMGENFNRLHRWGTEQFWADRNNYIIQRLKEAGVNVKDYAPSPDGRGPHLTQSEH